MTNLKWNVWNSGGGCMIHSTDVKVADTTLSLHFSDECLVIAALDSDAYWKLEHEEQVLYEQDIIWLTKATNIHEVLATITPYLIFRGLIQFANSIAEEYVSHYIEEEEEEVSLDEDHEPEVFSMMIELSNGHKFRVYATDRVVDVFDIFEGQNCMNEFGPTIRNFCRERRLSLS